MDPDRAARPAAGPGIPRTRGDGPAPHAGRPGSASDSPHARGWTRPSVSRPSSASGFPARAGMDPGSARSGTRCARIPRTRGDGPGASVPNLSVSKDSPHARGWTLGLERQQVARVGFPARAGMDPATGDRVSGPRRIPRTRGDGPGPSIRSSVRAQDSPHARGWTPGCRAHGRRRVGFPARAGMDPPITASSATWRGIPRTRGDGPPRPGDRLFVAADSPHARGWTLDGRTWDARAGGFPARAGMDRDHPRRASMRPRIPRTRGDGPALCSSFVAPVRDSPHARGWTMAVRQDATGAIGFPARAGMDPTRPRHSRSRGWIPRTRGDGPPEGRFGPNAAPDSPHARGWTRGDGGDRNLQAGFPARAGMDPRGRARRTPRSGIPRTRGDGPATTAPA